MEKLGSKKKYTLMIVITIIMMVLIIALLELYKNSIEKNKEEEIDVLTQSTNIIETPVSNEIVPKTENENKIIKENVVTENIIVPTLTEESTKIEKNKQNKNNSHIETKDDKTKDSSPERQEKTDNSKNTSKKDEEKISITVEGSDEKYPILNDEGQWYTQSNWFEIDEDVTFIER